MMRKLLVEELENADLDLAVAICENYSIIKDPMGFKTGIQSGFWIWEDGNNNNYKLIGHDYSPSTKFDQGGLIIEREQISISVFNQYQKTWSAVSCLDTHKLNGETMLIAAMRCYVRTLVGDVIELPYV